MNVDISENNFTNIYNTYYRRSFYFVKSYVHDEAVAEDITSDSLIKLWETIKASDINPIEPLLLTILKNKSLDYLKHEEIRREAIKTLQDWHQQELSLRLTSLEACNPDDIFSDEVKQIISDTLDTLSEETRQIFILSRFKEKNNKEIAEIMNISVKGVEYHITKALKVLRVALKDYLPLFYFFIYFSK
jgi:RNA polymerase sigma-70 factor (ECF subfamily)